MTTLEEARNHKDDKEYLMNVVKEDGLLLEAASDKLRDDKNLVLEAVTKDRRSVRICIR